MRRGSPAEKERKKKPMQKYTQKRKRTGGSPDEDAHPRKQRQQVVRIGRQDTIPEVGHSRFLPAIAVVRDNGTNGPVNKKKKVHLNSPRVARATTVKSAKTGLNKSELGANINIQKEEVERGPMDGIGIPLAAGLHDSTAVRERAKKPSKRQRQKIAAALLQGSRAPQSPGPPSSSPRAHQAAACTSKAENKKARSTDKGGVEGQAAQPSSAKAGKARHKKQLQTQEGDEERRVPRQPKARVTEELSPQPAEAGGVAPAGGPPRRPSSSLLDKMRAKLQGGKFRMLNEKLYTCRGEEAFELFTHNPEAFSQYHAGYREQVAHWPRRPVDIIIEWLEARSPSLSVADFGCGEARLAASVPNRVFSLDLVAANPSVIACNMAHTPLEAASVDVAVFCLSLMGTDYQAYVTEAHRVLKAGGWLLIAEVRSRFDPANGGADPGRFVKALTLLGFKLRSQDESNKMFLMFYFQKIKDALSESTISWPELKPCLYKRR
eukprot:jgi/Mesen1/3145/ME000184S02210